MLSFDGDSPDSGHATSAGLGGASQDARTAKATKSRWTRELQRLSAYSYRVPLCVPYWKAATYRAILSCFISGRVVEGPDIKPLERRVAQQFSVPAAIACGSGRSAIEIALRACGVGKGDEVVIPTCCCASVIPPIIAAGALPVLADVGDELGLTATTVEPACTPATRAILVPHLFGNPASIEAIVELGRARGIRVIDDAAQALGATLDGRPLGTFGDAGVISFGKGKVCFGVGGGILVASDPDVLSRARDVSLDRPGFGEAFGRAASVCLWRRWRRWSLPLHVALSRLVRRRAAPPPYRRQRMSNLEAAVASTLLETLDANVAARRERVRIYEQLLGGVSAIRLIPHRTGSACLTQVVRVEPLRGAPDVVAEVIRTLRDAGYEVDRSYAPLHAQASYVAYARTPLANAERVSRRLFELPCEPSVSISEVERIAAMVRRLLG